MNRKEFMERLEKLLWNISDSEREEALQYYNDYFDDAGAENEASVIEDLVSPEQVAQRIKAGLSDAASEYTENGYEDTRFRDTKEMISRGQAGSGETGSGTVQKKETNFWKILAIVLLIVLATPVILPLAAGILLVLAAVVIGILAAAFGIVVAGFAILVSGVILIGIGIAQMFVSFPVGLARVGAGCILFAIGILASMLTIWVCSKVVPWLIRSIVKIGQYPFRKAGAKK